MDLKQLASELMGQEVTVDTRTTERSYCGLLCALDDKGISSGFGPTVVLKDEEGTLMFVFDVSSVIPGSEEEEEEEEEEEDEDEEDGSDEEDDAAEED